MIWLQSPERFIKHVFIDFLRKQYGRIYKDGRDCKGNARARARNKTTSIDEPHIQNIPCEPIEEDEPTVDWRSYVSLNHRLELQVCDAILDDGLSSKELAERYGVTESRICQVLRVIKKQIGDTYILKRLYADYKEEPSKSLLSVQWIVI